MTDNIARALALKAQNQSSEGSTKVNKQIESLKEELAEKQPAGNYLTEETDPTVPEWAKQTSKPTYTASEIGALSEDTVIPSRTSELINDSDFAKNSAITSLMETVCPPLNESGNPVQCYPVAGSALGVTASWEPTQEGSGDPYPAGGGLNLLDISTCTATTAHPYGLTITIDNDIVKISGTPSNEVAKAGSYSFSVCSTTQAELKNKGYKITAFPTIGTVNSAWGLRTDDENLIAVAATLTPGVNTDVQFRLMVSKDTPVVYAPYSNIRPISGRNSVTVKRCGKNLMAFSEQLEDVLTKEMMSQDEALILSKALVGQKVTLTFTIKVTDIVFTDIVDEWRKRIGFELHGHAVDGAEIYTLQCWATEAKQHLTTNGEYVITSTVEMPALKDGSIQFYAQNIQSGHFAAYDFGLFIDTDTTNYGVPYTSQTTTLALPETIYGGEVDAVAGSGQSQFKCMSLDGTENWVVRDANHPHDYLIHLSQRSLTGICSHFKSLQLADLNAGTLGIYLQYTMDIIIANTSFETTDELVSYLAAQHAAGTPVQIAYKVATSSPFEAEGGQSVAALSGVNTVLTDADNVTVTGSSDPVKIIEENVFSRHTHNNKATLDNITVDKVNEWNKKSTFSGNYNDLTNKPTIPSKMSELTNDANYVKTSELPQIDATLKQSGQAADAAKTGERIGEVEKKIPTKVSDLTNDSGYATESQLLSVSYNDGIIKLSKEVNS